MDIVKLVGDARAMGLELVVDNDKLQVTGKKTPETASLIKLVAIYKAAVMTAITTELPVIGAVPSEDLICLELAALQVIEQGELPELPVIIHNGLTWPEAERIRGELQAQCGETRPLYGIGKSNNSYYIAQREYYR